MFEIRKPIAIGDAIQKIMEHPVIGSTELISIDDSYGRFLAKDLVATSDVPHFNRAPYDGFAVRSEDTKAASLNHPVSFKVIDHIGAGLLSKKEIQKFEAVRIMTGAMMPNGADAVVMFESTQSYEEDGESYITIKRSHKKGENVSFSGEDAKKGEILVNKGIRINPGIQAMLATFGYAQVPAARKPVAGLFATGTELLEVKDPLEPGKIRNSNAHMIMAQIERAGAEGRYLGKLPDDFDTSYHAIKNALDNVDILITTGGVSVGDFDYLPEIYEKLGAKVLFNKVAMRPGSVTTVAEFNDKLLFGLSGNPSACYVGFELFARPVMRKMLFSENPHLRKEMAILTADFPKPNPFTRFVRSTVTIKNGRLEVSPSGVDKSNIVMSLSRANALMMLPGGTRGYSAGAEVEVLLLEDQAGSEWPW